MTTTKIGIDAGGTLVKIVHFNQNSLKYHKIPSSDLQSVVSWVKDNCPSTEICITGGKAHILKSHFKSEVLNIAEFDATYLGVKYLLEENKVNLNSFILANVGTGTSLHYVSNDKQTRIGGTGVGGGTLMGLSKLLTGYEEYNKIVDEAKRGTRELDLKVNQIYEGAIPPIPGELTASNFGNIYNFIEASENKNNLLAAVIGLVGEVVSTLSVHASGQYGTKDIVYIGSSFINNNLFKEIVKNYTEFRGGNPLFLTNGEYSGAIGALLSCKEVN